MQSDHAISEIEKQTREILLNQLKSVEKLHSKLDDCQLSIEKNGTVYRTIITGTFNTDEIKAEGTDEKLLKSFLKASRFFNSAIQSTKAKTQVKNSMADSPAYL